MLQQFTARYFQQSGQVAGLDINVMSTSVRSVTLTDNDLVRGNDANESIGLFNGFVGANGFEFVFGTFNDEEAVTTVTFNDGTSLAGVRAMFDTQSFSYGFIVQQFLLDPAALASVGKTLDDIASVRRDAFVDHDLSWADFGFTPTGVIVPDPEPEPEPQPDPALTLLQGTNGNDRLAGTAADELIRGGNGDDRLTGREGADTFVFGADARDGNRDRDVITDFNAAEDTILFEAGATIRFVEERNGNLFIQLDGDRDSITVLNADRGIVDTFRFADDLFTA
jgi:Ca2+-binding RTX toxin-like protein